MQIVENWSDIAGELERSHASKAGEAFVTLELLVKEVRAVGGFKNLLEEAEGKRLEVNVPTQLVGDQKLHRGQKVRCRVRVAGPHNAFVHPEHFSISEK